jgi:RNA polymerase sigma-70 factor (ECF subfamily)
MTEGISLAIPATQQVADEVDLAALVQTHAALLFRVAHAILRNAAEAEDTVQDVFLRVLQHQQTLPAIRDLRPWLVRIAWNLALDRRRRIRPDQLDDLFAQSLVAATLPADRSFAESERFAAVLRELDRLPAKERQVLLLAALEELSTAEIAAITHRSESAVRALVFRARTRLRTRLQKAGHA